MAAQGKAQYRTRVQRRKHRRCVEEPQYQTDTEATQSPAQSLETLHNPQSDHAARGAALAGLQRAVGNAAIERAIVQRDGRREHRDPGQVEEERRERVTQERASGSAEERAAGSVGNVVLHHAVEHLSSLGDDALRDLCRAWRESPVGSIAAIAILGAAGAAYLAGTRGNVPPISIRLDFLADRVPAFRGGKITLKLDRPIIDPDELHFSIILREQLNSERRPARRGNGRVFTPRLTLRPGDVSAAGPEVGDELTINGRIPIPSDASRADVAATIAAIEDGAVEVDIGGTPSKRVTILSVTDSFKPDRLGLRLPPADRHLLVQLRTTVPPLFHQGTEAIVMRPVYVQINDASSEGDAHVRVRVRQLSNP